MNMEKKEFNKLLKNEEPEDIIRKYCMWKINLTSKELDKVIKLRQEKEKNITGGKHGLQSRPKNV